jgi:signal transduction histidine kinase
VALRAASRFHGRSQLALDALLVAVVFGGTVAMLGSGKFEDDPHALDAGGVLLAALSALPLLGRRRWPFAALVATTGACMALYSIGYSLGPPLGSLVALYHIASSPGERRPTPPLFVLVPLVGVLLATLIAGHNVVEFLLGAVVWGGAWLAGDRTRLRRERIAELEDRAQRAEREAVRERRLAAAEERTRIARDLHDSAGHAINVILVQAGAARLLQHQDPARSREALETIEEVARETIDEIDRLVRVLRDEEPGDQEPGVEPPPGLAAVNALAERHRSTGLEVTVSVEGSVFDVPSDVSRAAYRILQEALTNAALHGDGDASVRISLGEGVLALEVENTVAANGAGRAGGGLGLVGMRERAALLGGTLAADSESGRFSMRARIPYRGAPS